MTRPRVLVIAEAANPEWASVPLVGWSHTEALCNVADAHLVTQVRNRDAIVRAGWSEGDQFSVIDSEPVARPIWKVSSLLRGGAGTGWTTGMAFSTLAYYYFEHLVWREWGSRIAAGEYDVVHRVTPLSPTIASLIAKKCCRAGVPFVLGPLNGGVRWPRQFDAVRRREREWLSYARGAHRLMPGYRSTRDHAAALIMGSKDTWDQFPRRYHHKCVYIPENGIDPARFAVTVDGPVGLPLRVAFVGRLVPYKGVDMLLEAAAPLVRDGRVMVDIMGDGPEMPNVRELVRNNNLEKGVTLSGWVKHPQLQHRLAQSSVFGFPSVREFGGGVVLEAMALGLVPIVVDYAGPRELVTPATGYKVPIGTREEVVTGFRAVLTQMVEDPSGLRDMGRRARRRVMTHFTWEVKAGQTLEVYRWVLGERPEKPDFGMPFPDPEG